MLHILRLQINPVAVQLGEKLAVHQRRGGYDLGYLLKGLLKLFYG